MNQTHFELARCFCNKPVERREGQKSFSIYMLLNRMNFSNFTQFDRAHKAVTHKKVVKWTT